jgi:hypothetical protein
MMKFKWVTKFQREDDKGQLIWNVNQKKISQNSRSIDIKVVTNIQL